MGEPPPKRLECTWVDNDTWQLGGTVLGCGWLSLLPAFGLGVLVVMFIRVDQTNSSNGLLGLPVFFGLVSAGLVLIGRLVKRSVSITWWFDGEARTFGVTWQNAYRIKRVERWTSENLISISLVYGRPDEYQHQNLELSIEIISGESSETIRLGNVGDSAASFFAAYFGDKFPVRPNTTPTDPPAQAPPPTEP